MVDSARRRAAELGVTGVEFRVLDAQNLELADASTDGVVCRWGYMLMPDPAAALRETRRVLRPGGRLVFSVWGPPEKNPWAAIPARVLVEMGHIEPPRAGGPGIFALADPERIDALLLTAGFERPQVAEVTMDWCFDAFEQYGRTCSRASARCRWPSRRSRRQSRSGYGEGCARRSAPVPRAASSGAASA
jgi:ubiquinone/menaquinone biosynthesis C-methylase UbiE